MSAIYLLFLILYIVVTVFYWSLLIRRAHDLGYSGWFTLLFLIPIVNLVLLIYFLCASGDAGSNAYGESNVGKPFWRSVFGGSSKGAASVPPPPPTSPTIPPAPPSGV